MKLETKHGLEKLSDHLKDKDGEVSLELYTKEKYEFDRSLKFPIGDNYVLVLRSGKNHDSYWNYTYNAEDLFEAVQQSIETDDLGGLNECLSEWVTEWEFLFGGSDYHESQDAIEGHDFDEIPEDLLDEDTGEIDIEKLQDNYDFEVIEEEGDQISKFESLKYKTDDGEVKIDLN